MCSIYLISSLKNTRVPLVANALRAVGYDVFDDWYSVGPEADDCWKNYEDTRGRMYLEALNGKAANHHFKLDFKHLQECDLGVLVLPAGKSAHLELGYMRGSNRGAYILFDEEPKKDRWDLMYKLAHGIFFSMEELIDGIGRSYPARAREDTRRVHGPRDHNPGSESYHAQTGKLGLLNLSPSGVTGHDSTQDREDNGREPGV